MNYTATTGYIVSGHDDCMARQLSGGKTGTCHRRIASTYGNRHIVHSTILFDLTWALFSATNLLERFAVQNERRSCDTQPINVQLSTYATLALALLQEQQAARTREVL
jgi:hypothetical protein